VFIENGILKQYVLGLYSARRLNMQSTGNADGVHNLSVQSTVKDVHEMIGGIEKGFLVTDLMGQGVQILTGNYSRGAAGFWIENGKIQYPVEGVTIAGNLRDMFKGILAVGGDANKNYSTKCGSILIDKMMIAGK
jgi:PmbA protein